MGEAESSMSSVIPESNPSSFSIEGDEGRFFLDEGEVLGSKGEYPGFINFIAKDGVQQKFVGTLYDDGDHWVIERHEGKGEDKYRIPKAGVVLEVGQVAVEGIAAAGVDMPVGLEDAAAAVAMEAAGDEQREKIAKEALRQSGIEVGRITFGSGGSVDKDKALEKEVGVPGLPAAEVETPAPLAALPEQEAGGEGEEEDFGGYRLDPDAEGGIQRGNKLLGGIIGPDGKRFVGRVKRIPQGLNVIGATNTEGFIETPEKTMVGRIERSAEASAAETPVGGLADAAAEPELAVEPPVEPVTEASPVEPASTTEAAPTPEPSPAAVSEQKSAEAAASGVTKEFDDRLAEAKTAEEALELFEEKLNILEKGASREADELANLFEERGALRRELTAASKVADRKLPASRLKDAVSRAERDNILFARKRREEIQTRLDELTGGEGELTRLERSAPENEIAEARRIRRINELRAEAEKWRQAAENSNLLTDYNRLGDQISQVEANQLLPKSVRQMIIGELRGKVQAIESQLPVSYLEMVGTVREKRRKEGVALDISEENFAYNRAANRLFEMLNTRGVQPEISQPADLSPTSEPVLPPEPLMEEIVVQSIEAAKPAPETVEPVAGAEPVLMEEQPAEVTALPIAEEEEVAPEPMEAPVEATTPGQVVVDAAEQARAEVAKPAGAAAVSEPIIDQAPDWLASSVPMPEAPTIEASAEAAAQPTAEMSLAEQKERFEARKAGFAVALAELDLARGDVSGTEREQKVRLAEAFNSAIGAAM